MERREVQMPSDAREFFLPIQQEFYRWKVVCTQDAVTTLKNVALYLDKYIGANGIIILPGPFRQPPFSHLATDAMGQAIEEACEALKEVLEEQIERMTGE